jgi:hypothetical protein
MNARDQEFIKTTGQKVPVSQMSPFVGRVFALIDLVEWNATYGFLASKNLLTLNKDPELTLATPTVSGAIDFYVYGDAKHHKDVPHWGDLHYPISLPRAGTYDVSFVLPILTGLSGRLEPWTMALAEVPVARGHPAARQVLSFGTSSWIRAYPAASSTVATVSLKQLEVHTAS